MNSTDLFNAVVSILVPILIAFAVWRAGRRPLWAEAYRRIRRNPLAMISLGVLCVFGTIAVLDGIATEVPGKIESQSLIDKMFASVPTESTYSAPLAARTSESRPKPLAAPGKHLLGTDSIGSDVLLRTLKAVRVAFIIGGGTLLIAAPLAILLGLVAGYFGKYADDAVQYTYTVLSSIPEILLLIAIVLVMGKGVLSICVALGVTSWVGLCRLVRGETLRHRDREYVRAAKALGAGSFKIMTRHILPNLLPIVIISLTLSFSGIVLAESILSYLGVGLPADMPSWGNMINGARAELTRDPVVWWNLVAAAGALLILVLALNFLADALRDAIDPRLRSS